MSMQWFSNVSATTPQYFTFSHVTTTSSANITLNQKPVPNPRTADAPEQWPHYLRIINHAEDYGQDDYEEDLEYEIIHHDQCEREEDTSVDGEPFPMIKHFACPVGEAMIHDGIYTLHDEEGRNLDWKTLEPGDYAIEAWSSGPDYLGEYDGGLRLK